MRTLATCVCLSLITSACAGTTSEFTAGQQYRATHDIPVIAMTHWSAPYSGGTEAVLPAGEVFTIVDGPGEGATAVSCLPERYDALHPTFVSQEDRDAERYSGYSLVIDMDVIRSNAEPIPNGSS